MVLIQSFRSGWPSYFQRSSCFQKCCTICWLQQKDTAFHTANFSNYKRRTNIVRTIYVNQMFCLSLKRFRKHSLREGSCFGSFKTLLIAVCHVIVSLAILDFCLLFRLLPSRRLLTVFLCPACRHGSRSGIQELYEGHWGPVTGVSAHTAPGPLDFSHLFISSSIDWTIKLWSAKVLMRSLS